MLENLMNARMLSCMKATQLMEIRELCPLSQREKNSVTDACIHVFRLQKTT